MAQKQGSTNKEKKGEAAPLIREGPAIFYDQDRDEEFTQRQRQRTKSKRGDKLYIVAMVLFAVIFLVSGGLLVKRWFDDRKTENEFSDLQALIPADTDMQGAEGEAAPDNSAKFAALLARNPDFAGWISIEGTNLDYPVVQRPTEKDYYLKHDFNGNYSDYGVPYLDEKCTLSGENASNNLIIYGHNMKTGTIFGCLTNYQKAEYYAAHPQIEFDTLAGDASYTVFAAFAIDVLQDQTFLYNEFTDMDEQTFADYVAQVKGRSAVDTGITPAYGDTLLTLSTCEYSTSNGRFVVCAYKKAE